MHETFLNIMSNVLKNTNSLNEFREQIFLSNFFIKSNKHIVITYICEDFSEMLKEIKNLADIFLLCHQKMR